MPLVTRVTVLAPINIAFIKYWGKREGGESLILPVNDSFSITLANAPFRTKTTVELYSDHGTDDTAVTVVEDELWLNQVKTEITPSSRIATVLRCVRNQCDASLAKMHVRIISENNFPTAAGMASSASGFCALAAALVKIFKSSMDVSMLARLGSGSACRSALGGFVIWHKGTQPDGSDCIATQFVNETYWPEMQVLCAVLKGSKKDVSSTSGMQQSVQTSPMMHDRVNSIVPQRMAAIKEAILTRDFEQFAKITMADSDDLQEVCRTTTPPIQYATEDSYAMIKLIHAYNAKKQHMVAAYTFDAGANCFMFALRSHIPELIAVLMAHFPTSFDKFCFNDADLLESCKHATLPDDSYGKLIDHPHKSFEMLLQSPVGSGVEYLSDTDALSVPSSVEKSNVFNNSSRYQHY